MQHFTTTDEEILAWLLYVHLFCVQSRLVDFSTVDVLLVSNCFSMLALPTITEVRSGIIWCHMMSHDIMWHHTTPHDITWHHAMPHVTRYHMTPHNATWYDTMQCHMMSHDTMQCHMMPRDTMQCHMVSHDTMQCRAMFICHFWQLWGQ